MSALRMNRWLPKLLIVTACVVVAAQSSCASAAEPEGRPAGAVHAYTSKWDCFRCHTAPTEEDTRAGQATGVLARVKLTEKTTWEREDWHRLAFDALQSPRGKLMGEVLGWNVASDTRCLSCHSGHCAIDMKQYPQTPVTLTSPNATIRSLGVSCEACHGPADDWEARHWKDEGFWRLPADKKADLGLLDVRHPIARAEVCLSCHIGDSRQGKIITHDMYAAGHPPLPGFEIETFDAALPVHGLTLAEKAAEARPQWRYGPGDLYRTRSALTASMVALRLQVRLVADEARWAQQARQHVDLPAPGEKRLLDQAHSTVWPQLALFDCAACHHELKTASWRQDRGYQGPPGRPMLRSWPTALYYVAGGQPASLEPLRSALSRQPFGDPKSVVLAAEQVLAQVNHDLQVLETSPINQAAALGFLRQICAVGTRDLLDYDDARQLAWAWGVIHDELQTADPTLWTDEQRGTFTNVRAAWDSRLSLGVAQRQASRSSLEANQASLRQAIVYDPRPFQAELKQIAAALGPSR